MKFHQLIFVADSALKIVSNRKFNRNRSNRDVLQPELVRTKTLLMLFTRITAHTSSSLTYLFTVYKRVLDFVCRYLARDSSVQGIKLYFIFRYFQFVMNIRMYKYKIYQIRCYIILNIYLQPVVTVQNDNFCSIFRLCTYDHSFIILVICVRNLVQFS